MGKSIRRGFGRAALVVGTMFTTMVCLAGAAVAQTTVPDPTGGAANTALTNTQGWVTSYGAPLLAGLLVLGAVFIVLIKFVKKGARAV